MSEPSTLRDVRDKRRAERLSGLTRPDYMTVIVEAAERALAETPFHKITIDQILNEAQVSRATFYAYFSSKGEVVAEVLGRVMLELFELLDPLFQRLPDDSRQQAIAAVLEESAKLWKLHRPVFHATHENWHSVPELRVKWLELVEKFTDAIADQLQRGANHTAARGRRARQRSAALLWSSEQLFYLAGTDADDDLANEQELLETLATMWEGTLFGLE